MISIQDQIKSAARELALRRNTYPKRVLANWMTQATADLELERMQAIIDSLNTLGELIAAAKDIENDNGSIPDTIWEALKSALGKFAPVSNPKPIEQQLSLLGDIEGVPV